MLSDLVRLIDRQMPPPSDWLSWEFWVANRDNIVPLATFFVQLATLIGAAIVAIAALAQARTARRRHEEQTAADRERRITESFAKAVEQLGSDKLETCLGAIYTLERISRESEREYWPIMETLTAYVREHVPWPPRKGGDKTDDDNTAVKKPEDASEQTKASAAVEPWTSQGRTATDIQAVLTVLGRRDEKARKQDQAEQRHLDLGATDLRGIFLQGAHLQNAFLWGAHLERANLLEAHLEGAYLIKAHLKNTNLLEAHFEGAHLQEAHLEHATLWRAHFEGADLRGVHLENADLRHATGLTQEQVNTALGDQNTILPEGLTRPARWKRSGSRRQAFDWFCRRNTSPTQQKLPARGA